MDKFNGVTRDRLEEILSRMDNVKSGILGDICLDVYWHADMRKSELSRETPHYMLPVVEERMSPGGGANVAANMAALKPKSVNVFGVTGSDWRGRELIRLLSEQGIGVNGVVTGTGFSNAYIKPMRQGYSDVIYEDPRLDFISHEPISSEIEDKLIAALDKAVGDLDVLCVSDQLSFGVVTRRVREHICGLARRGLRVVADSRYNIGLFTDVFLKPNELEGATAAGMDSAALSGVSDYERVAQALATKTGCDVFMTIGDKGSIYVKDRKSRHIPARKLSGPIDIVGAGDSSISGFALALAAGAEAWEAAFIAGLCSEITVQQVGITGTASRKQLLDWYTHSISKTNA